MNVKAVVKAVQTWTPEEWDLSTQLRKLGNKSEAPKPRRKYTRKAKTEADPKPAKRAAKGNGGDEATPVKRGPGRPRKVRTMIPVVGAEAEHIEA